MTCCRDESCCCAGWQPRELSLKEILDQLIVQVRQVRAKQDEKSNLAGKQ